MFFYYFCPIQSLLKKCTFRFDFWHISFCRLYREVCIGRGLCAIEPLGNISIDFCFFWLILLKDYFNENSTGSTFSSISGEIIRNAFIPLPPLAEQHRIVEKIETYFSFLDTIENSL